MTKTIFSISIACALCGVGSSPASAAFVNGQDLAAWSSAYERAAAGVANTSDFGPASELRGFVIGAYDQLESNAPVRKCFVNPTKGQVTQIVVNYVKAHPEQWDRPGVTLIYAALLQACKSN